MVAKVEWHSGELYPRVGFIVTNLSRPAERVVAFYNQRGTAEMSGPLRRARLRRRGITSMADDDDLVQASADEADAYSALLAAVEAMAENMIKNGADPAAVEKFVADEKARIKKLRDRWRN